MQSGTITGIHHPSVGTKNFPEILDFYSRVMGLKLVAWYLMHGAIRPITRSTATLKSPIPDYRLFKQTRDQRARSLRRRHHRVRRQRRGLSGIGAVLWIRRRLGGRARRVARNGRAPSQIVDRGYCKMFSFKGPESANIVIALDTARAADRGDWIDASLASKLGLTAADLARYVAPKVRKPPAGVPNPPFAKSRYKFVKSADLATFPFLSNKTLTFLMSDTNAPNKSSTWRARWLAIRKAAVVLPRVAVLKIQGRI